jgi:hypothetical protein
MSDTTDPSHGTQPARRDDIPTPRLEVQKLKWSSPEETQGSIALLFQFVEAHVLDAIAWYAKHKRHKALLSRSLRLWAILCTTLGGLAPILDSLFSQDITVEGAHLTLRIGQLGYFFLALAAACIGLDRFFGFSSGWMRYITTMMSLDRALSEFRLDWALMIAKLGGRQPDADEVQQMIQRLKHFLAVVDTQVEEETQAWVAEFRLNLAEIEKSAKAQAEASRPGGIDLTVTNGKDAEDGFAVVLDGVEVTRVHGAKYQIGGLAPGPHKVAVAGKIRGAQVDASELVQVMPGTVANVTLAFPVRKGHR